MKNFFRKDLHLENKPWHRAILVGYIVFILIGVCITYELTFSDDRKFDRIEPLSKYYTNQAKTLLQIEKSVKPSYRVGEENYFSTYGNTEYDVYKYNVYCSNNITNGIDSYTYGEQKVNSFMLEDLNGRRVEASKERLTQYIKSNNVKCISVDAYTDTFGNKLSFIEPYEKTYWFYEYSTFGTFLNFLINLWYIVLIGVISVIIYYKAILYIIYGKQNPH
jgi:hypothetical protein